MTFDPMSIVNTIIGFLSAIPAVGPYLVLAAKYTVMASTICTAIVAVMHGVIAVCSGLAQIPGLSSLASISSKLQSWDTEGEGFLNQYLLPILDRFSAYAVPSAPAAPAAPAVVPVSASK